MKVYVLAVSNNEGTCRPDVFTTREKAQEALKTLYNETIESLMNDYDDNFLEDSEIYENSFFVRQKDEWEINADIYECETDKYVATKM